VDIDPHTLNLDPNAVRAFLEQECKRTSAGTVINARTGRTIKAILPVHVFGYPCEMKALLELAAEYDLLLLEDACEAIGAQSQGKAVGSCGNAGVFAFYPNKQITTGEGGMVVTDDSSIADFCRSMRNQGRDSDSAWLRHLRLGFNYRLSDVQAALGLAQLERLQEILLAREEVARRYSKRLSGHSRVIVPSEPSGAKRSWFVYVVQLPEPSLRSRVRAHLASKGIASQVYFPAIYHQDYFQALCPDSVVPLPNTERAADSCLALPFWSRMTGSQIDLVCDELLAALDQETLANARPGASVQDAPSVEARL
jgi:perosamine synthetase